MPLEKGSSRKVVSDNVREMMNAGHSQSQSVAASLRNARASRKSKRKGRSHNRRGRG